MQGKSNLFMTPLITVGKGLIRWENRTCLLSAVSQLWIGKAVGRRWGAAAETGAEGLNLELNSGSSLCFVSDSHDFLVQAYELLSEMIAGGESGKKYLMDFEKNLLEEPEDLAIPASAAPASETPGSRSVRQEMQMLLERYRQKEEAEPGALALLEEIAACCDGENSSDLSELYKRFIQLSLIRDCNELGLNLLIDDIKTRIYGPVKPF